MRVIIIGRTGQLGRSIEKLVNENSIKNFIFVDRNKIDLNHDDSIDAFFKNNEFNLLVNCAAFTDVEKAERQKELVNQINHLAVLKMAKFAEKQNARFIHISTDYVFDGKKNLPYKENDIPNPINVYGKSKLDGEKAIFKIMPKNAIIIRSSWIYSEFRNNFVKKVMNIGKNQRILKVVNDQYGSPTYAFDLAKVILKIINHKNNNGYSQKSEIFNYSNEGEISWYDFAKEIIKISKLSCSVEPIITSDFKSDIKRPKNSSLDKEKIKKKYDLTIPFWKLSLVNCINQLL